MAVAAQLAHQILDVVSRRDHGSPEEPLALGTNPTHRAGAPEDERGHLAQFVVVELDGHDSAAKKFGHSHSGLLLSEDK
jgi:hypothetical protein